MEEGREGREVAAAREGMGVRGNKLREEREERAAIPNTAIFDVVSAREISIFFLAHLESALCTFSNKVENRHYEKEGRDAGCRVSGVRSGLMDEG